MRRKKTFCPTLYTPAAFFPRHFREMNNFFIQLTLFIWCSRLVMVCTVEKRPVEEYKLTALNDSLHTLQLHQQFANKDRPSCSDPATTDARVRKRICLDIFENSRYFQPQQLYGVEMAELYETLNRRQNLSSHQIFRNKKYWNPYERRQFRLASTHDDIEEYVFTCFLKHWWTRQLTLFYISKEYNLNLGREPSKPGRFIFGQYVPNNPNSLHYMMLAEEPAEIYTEPDGGFNVELHYLLKRKDSSPASGNDTDPLCKLISDKLSDLNDQHYRLCVAVLRSSAYENQINYPKRDVLPCWTKRISFRTPEGIREAADEEYFERVTLCHSTYVNRDLGEMVLYISRAYESNRIFVYRHDVDDRIYLENMCTNINVIEDNYYFY